MATRKILRVAISNTCIRFLPGISQVIFTLKLRIIQTLGRMVNLHCRYYPSLFFMFIFSNSVNRMQFLKILCACSNDRTVFQAENK
jgi:hypothetical protein